MQVQFLHSSPAFTVYAISILSSTKADTLKTVWEIDRPNVRGKVRLLALFYTKYKNPANSQSTLRKEVKQTMARKPMVTRSLKSTVATIACYNTVTNEIVTKDIELARTYPSNDKLMKAAVPVLESANLKPVHVLKTDVVRTLYGMPEQSFIEHAEKLTDSEAVEPEE